MTLLWCFACHLLTAQVYAQKTKSIVTPNKTIDSICVQAARYFKLNQKDSTKQLLDRARSLCYPNAYTQKLAYIFSLMARLNVASKNHSTTAPLFDSAAKYYHPALPYDILFEYYQAHAVVYLDMDKSDSSLHYLYALEKLNERCNKSYANWWVYNTIGTLFFKEKKYDLAENNYFKAYEITKQKQIRMDMGLVLYRLARLFIAANEPYKYSLLKKEIVAFNLSKPNRKPDDELHTFYLVDDQSLTLQQKVDFLNAAKKVHYSKNDMEYVVATNTELASLYQNNNMPEAALQCELESDSLMTDENSLLLDVYSNKKNIFNLYKQLGKPEKATEYALDMLSLNEKLHNSNNKKLLYDLEAKYQNEKKELAIAKLNSDNNLKSKEIEWLSQQEMQNKKSLQQALQLKLALLNENALKDSVMQKEILLNEALRRKNLLQQSEINKESALRMAVRKENELKATQLQKQKMINWYLIAALILFLSLAATVLLMYKKQRQKNKIIQKQASDLGILMKEIHHRVKNNLQVVSGLLELQSHSIVDEKSAQAILDGKNRIQSMALIHQNLYTDENLKAIEVKPYLVNLVASICNSYNIHEQQIDFDLNIDDLKLDVDTMIPLGLILNELITNSLKYAFANVVNKKIHVVLNKQAKHLFLQVADNGVGFPLCLDISSTQSFGLKLIRSFANKLKAQLDIKNKGGAVVSLTILNYKLG